MKCSRPHWPYIRKSNTPNCSIITPPHQSKVSGTSPLLTILQTSQSSPPHSFPDPSYLENSVDVARRSQVAPEIQDAHATAPISRAGDATRSWWGADCAHLSKSGRSANSARACQPPSAQGEAGFPSWTWEQMTLVLNPPCLAPSQISWPANSAFRKGLSLRPGLLSWLPGKNTLLRLYFHLSKVLESSPIRCLPPLAQLWAVRKLLSFKESEPLPRAPAPPASASLQAEEEVAAELLIAKAPPLSTSHPHSPAHASPLRSLEREGQAEPRRSLIPPHPQTPTWLAPAR